LVISYSRSRDIYKLEWSQKGAGNQTFPPTFAQRKVRALFEIVKSYGKEASI